MDPVFILAIIGLLPVILFTLLRVNAAVAYLALCLGSVLGAFVAEPLVDILRGFIAPANEITDVIARLTLLWLPVILVMFFMAQSIGSRQRWINLLPAISVGLLGILLSVPFLAVETQIAIGDTALWAWLESYSAAIVATGTIISLLLLRMRKPLHEHHASKHHH